MVDRARPNWQYKAEPPPVDGEMKSMLEYVFRQFQAISLAFEAMRNAPDDLVVREAAKGLVLKDTQSPPHYWRVTVDTSGALVVSDLGAVRL